MKIATMPISLNIERFTYEEYSMLLALLVLFSMLSTTVAGINDNENRYNPYRKRIGLEITPPGSRSPEQLLEEPEDSFENFYPEHEPDTTPHTPLGTICISTYTYGSYFLQHDMEGPILGKQKSAPAPFCNVLELLANLADADISLIRLDTYITNVINIALSLKNASTHDATITLSSGDFPLISSLSAQSIDNSDLPLIVHHALREQSTGMPLITQLFTELQTYTAHKLSATLTSFRADTQQFLTLTQKSPEQLSQSDLAQLSDIERKSMGSLGWLCRHAANTCMDLVETVPSSPLLAHTGALMNQIQQMLSTMALTYRNLSTNTVRSQDQNSLATHYTHMVEQLKDISPRRGHTSLLHYVHTLPNTKERQSFIEKVFASPEESNAFLQEFFPTLTDSLNYNLAQFCTTLTMQVIDVFAKRYWLCDKQL
jgi:hypothetical protein